jgi:hypothetical protein
MSIFRDTFPDFVSASLLERQTGMATRDPAFLHQLNSRTAWVRMTSGVDYQGTNNLAEQYVLQGGTLNNSSLRYGLGGNGTSTYDTKSPGGSPHRMGIRPMPGITNVDIQSRGAYGSLQEATVSFTCWDISQLEELEILYMRPGYTVLLEFGWSYINPIPNYSNVLLNKPPTSLNEAFDSISKLVKDSKGNYDALIGYVKNYNWSARDDGGYDCTTTIISLGEVLESLKCNWVPMNTTAFSNNGILGQINSDPQVVDSYQQGIIPGLLHELWNFLLKTGEGTTNPNFAPNFYDKNTKSTYFLCMSEAMGQASKNDRAGFSKYLGKDTGNVEGWITLGSFCELINNYVLLKDQNNNPIAQILPYETDLQGNVIQEQVNGVNVPKSLTCIASPFALSTNPGVCWIRNDNWSTLEISSNIENESINTDIVNLSQNTKNIIENYNFRNFAPTFENKLTTTSGYAGAIRIQTTTYAGNLENDIKEIAIEIVKGITDVKLNEKNEIVYYFYNGKSFTSNISVDSIKTVNLFDFIFTELTQENDGDTTESAKLIYNQLFPSDPFDVPFSQDIANLITENNAQLIEITGNRKTWTKDTLISKIKEIFSKVSLSSFVANKLINQTPILAQNTAQAAANTSLLNSGLQYFLIPSDSIKKKTLGRIANIYVNINYLRLLQQLPLF